MLSFIKRIKETATDIIRALDSNGGPFVTYLIIAGCTFVHLNGRGWAFSLSDLFKQPLTLIGYQFTHPTFSHLFGNMLMLVLFGPACEAYLGRIKFVFLFLVSGILSALGFAMIWEQALLVGASGAISGLIAIFPLVQKRFYERLVAGAVCIIYFWLQVISTIQDIQLPNPAQVAHFAHLVGGVAGLICFSYFFRRN